MNKLLLSYHMLSMTVQSNLVKLTIDLIVNWASKTRYRPTSFWSLIENIDFSRIWSLRARNSYSMAITWNHTIVIFHHYEEYSNCNTI